MKSVLSISALAGLALMAGIASAPAFAQANSGQPGAQSQPIASNADSCPFYIQGALDGPQTVWSKRGAEIKIGDNDTRTFTMAELKTMGCDIPPRHG